MEVGIEHIHKKNNEESLLVNSLPSELIGLISYFLPHDDLYSMRLVCSKFYDLLTPLRVDQKKENQLIDYIEYCSDEKNRKRPDLSEKIHSPTFWRNTHKSARWKASLDSFPLIFAAKIGSVKCVELLLLVQVHFQVIDKAGNNFLYYAFINFYTEAFKDLLDNLNKLIGDEKMLKLMESSNYNNYSLSFRPQIFASSNRKASGLIASNFTMELGRHFPERRESRSGEDIFAEIIKHIKQQNHHYFVKQNHLLEEFLNENYLTPEGRNFLHIAVQSGADKVLIALLALIKPRNLPVVLNHQDRQGNTPLHLAVALQNLKLAEILIDHGAQVSIFLKNHEEKNPFQIAMTGGLQRDISFKVCDYLKEVSSSISAEEKEQLLYDLKISKFDSNFYTSTETDSSDSECGSESDLSYDPFCFYSEGYNSESDESPSPVRRNSF